MCETPKWTIGLRQLSAHNRQRLPMLIA